MSKSTFRRKNPRYLLKQGNVWYVQYQIPKDVRHDPYFLKEDSTQRKQLWQTTKTPDQKDAEVLAAKYVAEYKLYFSTCTLQSFQKCFLLSRRQHHII